jgi:hypothetical protein
MKRLAVIKEAIINSIKEYVIDRDETIITDEVEIHYKGDVYGYVKFTACREVLEEASGWNYDFPPTPESVKITIDFMKVELYSFQGLRLINIENKINENTN